MFIVDVSFVEFLFEKDGVLVVEVEYDLVEWLKVVFLKEY